MSETTGSERIGARDQRDLEREDPSVAGQPEVPAGGEEDVPAPDAPQVGRREEREERQQAVQQHGDTFAVDSDQPTDTSGVEQESASNRATVLPENESDGDDDNTVRPRGRHG